jgi:GMP synthase-like glutamine amidotransferase
MEEILVFQNDPLIELGTFQEHLTACGLGYRYVRLFDGDVPDSHWDDVRALIVLGGHMSIDDETRYPYLRWEKTVLRMAIKRGLVMLGISLGAQLIACAAGAKAYPGRFKEIGWYPISLTAEGQFDALVGRLPETATVFQWNVGGVDLPPAALRLASSSYFKNAAFRLGRTIYGLNFHLETTPQLIDSWIERYGNELGEAPYLSAEKIRADTVSYAHSFKRYGERFFVEFTRRLLKHGRKENDNASANI